MLYPVRLYREIRSRIRIKLRIANSADILERPGRLLQEYDLQRYRRHLALNQPLIPEPPRQRNLEPIRTPA